MTRKLTPARRVESFEEIIEPGDYFGPAKGWTGDKEACFFLLPIARDPDVRPEARSIHHVAFPPHTYRECKDGSLEIRASIASLGVGEGTLKHIWHGFLDEGNVWREV